MLLATRERILTSDTLGALVANGSVGGTASEPWVYAELGDDGFPLSSGVGLASVTVFLHSRQWSPSANSARYPTIGVFVDAQAGAFDSSGEYLCRNVADALINELDDPARKNTGWWSNSIYVSHCRWAGDLISARYEDEPTKYRAEFSLELEVV